MENAAAAITCGSCNREYRWKPELAGKRVKCKCGGRVVFPVDEPAEELALVDEVHGGSDDVGEMDLAPQPNQNWEPEPAPVPAPPPPVANKTLCPGCQRPVAFGTVICTACGTNVQSGKKLKTKVGPDGMEIAGKAAAVAGRLALSLVLGGVAAVIMAVAWLAIVIFTGYQIGIVAWLVGVVVGGAIRLVNPSGGTVAGLAGAGFAFFSLAIVKLVLVLICIGAGIGLSAAFSVFDVLWVALAVSSAYKLASGQSS